MKRQWSVDDLCPRLKPIHKQKLYIPSDAHAERYPGLELIIKHSIDWEIIRRQYDEIWNSANSFIFYGRQGEISTNRREDQEVAMLTLHLLQNCLVFINTLMIRDVLNDPAWRSRMTPTDLRALTPLTYHHVNPYGLFTLDMTTRLVIGDGRAAA